MATVQEQAIAELARRELARRAGSPAPASDAPFDLGRTASQFASHALQSGMGMLDAPVAGAGQAAQLGLAGLGAMGVNVPPGVQQYADTLSHPVSSMVNAGEQAIAPAVNAATGRSFPTVQQAAAAPQRNAWERNAAFAGQMAPNAVFPGSGAARVVNVAVPTITGQGAREAMRALGGSDQAQQWAQMGGAVAGGVGANLRLASPNPAATGIDPSMPVPPRVAAKAAQYAASRLGSPNSGMVEAAQAGLPVTTAEMGGPQAQIAARALASQSGTTGSSLETMLTGQMSRTAQTPALFGDAFHKATGIDPAAIRGDVEGVIASQAAKADPLYTEIKARPGPVWNADLARLAERPAIKKAMAAAATLLKNQDINPTSQGLPIDPETGAVTTNLANLNETQAQPTAQGWLAIKQTLTDSVERDPFGKPLPESASPQNTGLNTAGRDLTAALKAAIPGYDKAVATSGEGLSMRSAFQRGQDLLMNTKVRPGQFAASFQGETAPNQEALKAGVAAKIFDMAQNGGLTARQLMGGAASPNLALGDKLRAVLGKDQANAFLKTVSQVADMNASGAYMLPRGGSPTAAVNAEIAAQNGPAAGFVSDVMQRGSIPRAVTSNITRRIAGAADTFVSGQMGMSQPVRDEAGRILLGNMTPKRAMDYARSVQPGSPFTVSPTLKALASGGRMPPRLLPPKRGRYTSP